MSPISRFRQQEQLQSSEDASDYFCCDWLTCQQLSNHQQLQRGRKKKKPLMWGSGLFVLWADFCGSRCRRNATEKGIFNNLPRQTVWRHMLLKRGHIQLFQRFLWTPTVSLKKESRATVWVNCLADPNMTGCSMACNGANLITWTAQLSQWRTKYTYSTNHYVWHFLKLIVALQDEGCFYFSRDLALPLIKPSAFKERVRIWVAAA